MKIALIWAMAENRVIGRDGDLPWRLPVDLEHFKNTTYGQPVIMGRKTWESLPGALPGRRNLVVTRQKDYAAEGAEVFGSVDAALQAARKTKPGPMRAFILGGAEIYNQTLSRAHELYVTFVHAEVEGDTHFPEFDLTEWRVVEREQHPADEDNEYACTMTRLEPAKGM